MDMVWFEVQKKKKYIYIYIYKTWLNPSGSLEYSKEFISPLCKSLTSVKPFHFGRKEEKEVRKEKEYGGRRKEVKEKLII